MKDLHLLPRVEDGWSFLHVQHCRIEQDGKSICIWEGDARTPVPCAAISLLMLGPGTAITHAAVRVLAESGCLILWTGEEGVRVYGAGFGETRSARNLLRQAAAWANAETRMRVVRRMYAMRFKEEADNELSLQQWRGREGARVRTAYAEASESTGVEWKGREYNRKSWSSSDPVNRALSCANSCLYGICHSAILAAGYSPAIGFIHTGKALSFVYDIADLYKVQTTIPAAFMAVRAGTEGIEGRVRRGMRDLFLADRLLERILPDLAQLFEEIGLEADGEGEALDEDDGMPGGLWDPVEGRVQSGVNYDEGNDNGHNDSGEGAGKPAR